MILSDSGSISIPAEALTRTTFDSYPLQFVEVLVSEIRLEGDLDEFQSSNGEETFI